MEMETSIFEPATVFTKTYIEGFFCPRCNNPLVRTRDLALIKRNKEHWTCSKCNQKMRLTDNGGTVIFKIVDEEPSSPIICAENNTIPAIL